jgi:hypothetical protein
MRLAILALCAVLLWPAAVLATTYLVRPDGTGDFPTIQAAINASVNGDVIELADGTFTGPGNRDIRYGGKAITVRSASGDPDRTIIDCEGSAPEHHCAFIFDHGEGPGSILAGVTIANGFAVFGGGIFLTFCNPTLLRCTFYRNFANNGGGLDCDLGATPRIVLCTFRENAARYSGGGMCI